MNLSKIEDYPHAGLAHPLVTNDLEFGKTIEYAHDADLYMVSIDHQIWFGLLVAASEGFEVS